MQISQWPIELIVLFVVAALGFVAIGFLLAAVIFARKNAQLSAQEAEIQALMNQQAE